MQGEKWLTWMPWLNFLKEGHLGGAAIDVYPWEPEKNGDKFTTPLQRIEQCVITPHIGAAHRKHNKILVMM